MIAESKQAPKASIRSRETIPPLHSFSSSAVDEGTALCAERDQVLFEVATEVAAKLWWSSGFDIVPQYWHGRFGVVRCLLAYTLDCLIVW
jgi:hypothetical protein